MWEDSWLKFVPLLDYSPEARRVLYSTNAIESLDARLSRTIWARGHFPTEQATLKCLYLAVRSLEPPVGAAAPDRDRLTQGGNTATVQWIPALRRRQAVEYLLCCLLVVSEGSCTSLFRKP
ncbi:Transposase, Mutator family [Actinopolyspora xinjiangensis]|uniref:Transposase, Mutator family n=1 Tax=Actinopolyspora xinjiangensis TaxID=405564 RepID=A0A1H0WJF2_9ACTN|nr:Transposase, Mutator family [Actinopolyspora xinjiangensis]